MQIEHYQKLYSAMREVRSVRDNISNSLVAIKGLLINGQSAEAIDYIDRIDNEVAFLFNEVPLAIEVQ